jgi:hypothetical protein
VKTARCIAAAFAAFALCACAPDPQPADDSETGEPPTYLEAPARCSKDSQCGLCQRCRNHRCESQAAGQDARHQCAATGCLTGKCNGRGACAIRADHASCGGGRACFAGQCLVPDAGPGLDGPADGTPEIEASAGELVFSAVRGTRSVERALVLRNSGDGDLRVTTLVIGGTAASSFQLVSPPALPATIAPAQQLSLRLVFAPSTTSTLGERPATLTISSNDADEGTLVVGLHGLATKGEQGGNEPPLAQVVATLGYAVNVGGATLELGTGAAPIGDEVRAPLFHRAGPGPITLRPVARYSPDEPIPFGIYTGAATPTLQRLGTIAMGQEQTLLPTVTSDSVDSADPGDASFGLFTTSHVHTVFSQDTRNSGADTVHAARSYPLKDRAGNAVPNAFLVGFEEAKNGDYNDYVFVLTNVTPAP